MEVNGLTCVRVSQGGEDDAGEAETVAEVVVAEASFQHVSYTTRSL